MIKLHKILSEKSRENGVSTYNTEEIWVNKGAIVQIDIEHYDEMDHHLRRDFTRVWLINGVVHRVIETGETINAMEN